MSETFFNPNLQNTDADTVTTMGGLEGLPAFNLGNFLGTAEQLAQLFPGGQEQPKYTPGLTDLTYTRSFTPGGSDTGIYWSPIPSTAQPQDQGAAPGSGYYVPNIPLPEDETSPQQASLLAGLLGSLFTAAASPQAEAERLARLKAAAQDINISNVFKPSNINYQTQSQQQKQWMGGQGQGQEQDQQDDSQDNTSLQDILDSIANNTDGGGFDSDFFTDTLPGGNVTDTIGGGNYVDTIIDTTKGTTKTDTQKGGNADDFINLDDIFEGTDTQQGGNTTDSIIDTSKGTSKTDTLKGGNGLDDIDLGTWENQQTIDGGNGNDTYVAPQPTDTQKQQVRDAYQQTFGRPPDDAGLDYWAGQLASGKSSTDLLRDLVSGAQGADVQAAQNTDTVSKLYEDLLGRAPDPEGLSYYRSQLAAGATPEDVARNLISGAKAGSEASKISQEEYERYFPPASTQTGPVTNDNIQDLFPNVSPGDLAVARDVTERLQYYANQYMEENAGASFDTSLFDPETFRDNFITTVAARDPGLFSQISGLDLQLTELGEGMVGNTALPLVGAVNAAFNSDSFAEAASNIDRAFATAGIADVAATALAAAGLPVVGQVAAAAIMLDSVLSKALGYDSPIQDGVNWMAQQTEKAMEYISDTFGDVFNSIEDFVGGIGDFFGDFFGDIGDWFAEGGLVDLPGDSMYNDGGQVNTFAMGGLVPLMGGGKIVKGPGGGLDDLIPTTIDGKRAAALSDGEFVVPADVVSMMGDGSSTAGAKRLYDLVKGVRQHKTGTSRQAGPLPVGKILERTMR